VDKENKLYCFFIFTQTTKEVTGEPGFDPNNQKPKYPEKFSEFLSDI
jgi:hypothetical protein